MSPLTIRLVRSAALAFALGLLLGVWFAFNRAVGAVARPLHAELNLWGGVTLLIYGVGYHMLPRFAGRPLTEQRLADLQSYSAILGVAVAVLGWLVSLWWPTVATPLLLSGAALQLVAALLFVRLIGSLVWGKRSHA